MFVIWLLICSRTSWIWSYTSSSLVSNRSSTASSLSVISAVPENAWSFWLLFSWATSRLRSSTCRLRRSRELLKPCRTGWSCDFTRSIMWGTRRTSAAPGLEITAGSYITNQEKICKFVKHTGLKWRMELCLVYVVMKTGLYNVSVWWF